MAIFMTSKEAKEKIETLENRVTELDADVEAIDVELQAAQANLATATEAVATITAERDKLTADLAAANATIADRDATIAAQPTAEQIEEQVEQRALAKFQSLGGEPVPASTKDNNESPSSMTREEFNSLSPAKRVEFSKSGGKLK